MHIWSLVWRDRKSSRPRPGSLPLARLAYEAEIIADDQAAIERVNQAGFDPGRTVLLGVEPPCDIGPAPAETGRVEIMLADPGFWRIQSDNPAPAILILAESAYPGWRVTVDGHAAEALTAYTTFKAVCVPAGAHVVEWELVPTAFVVGGVITLGALVLLAIACVITFSKRKE